MKVADNKKGRPSAEQLAFLDNVGKLGYGYAICYGAEQAKKVICQYYGYDYEISL